MLSSGNTVSYLGVPDDPFAPKKNIQQNDIYAGVPDDPFLDGVAQRQTQPDIGLFEKLGQVLGLPKESIVSFAKKAEPSIIGPFATPETTPENVAQAQGFLAEAPVKIKTSLGYDTPSENSVGRFLQNAGKDVVDLVVGFPAQVASGVIGFPQERKKAIETPKEYFQEAGKQTWEMLKAPFSPSEYTPEKWMESPLGRVNLLLQAVGLATGAGRLAARALPKRTSAPNYARDLAAIREQEFNEFVVNQPKKEPLLALPPPQEKPSVREFVPNQPPSAYSTARPEPFDILRKVLGEKTVESNTERPVSAKQTLVPDESFSSRLPFLPERLQPLREAQSVEQALNVPSSLRPTEKTGFTTKINEVSTKEIPYPERFSASPVADKTIGVGKVPDDPFANRKVPFTKKGEQAVTAQGKIQEGSPEQPAQTFQQIRSAEANDGNVPFTTQKIQEVPKEPTNIPENNVTRETPEQTEFKSRVYDRLKEDHPELTDDATYSKINLQDQADKSVTLMNEDPNKAYKIAMGAETSPDVTSTSVNIAMAEKALVEGNHKLYEQLVRKRSLDQTRRGQEIVSEKASVTDNSPTRYVKELIKTRAENISDKFLSLGKLKKETKAEKVTRVIDQEVKRAEKQISSKRMGLKEAQAFIDRLACK